MERAHDDRAKQVAVAAGILMLLTAVVTGLLVGWRFLPGLLGEWVGMMIGIVTTPFFMEASFAILGLILVVTLNHWRQHKDGDECVYLDQVAGPELPRDLPEQAKWAVYRQKPLPGEAPTLLTQAEGAFAIGDYTAAAEWIGAMGRDELKQAETLQLRLDLARATGKTERAHELEEEIRQLLSGQVPQSH